MLQAGERREQLRRARIRGRGFREFIEQTRLVVGVTQMDLQPVPVLEEYGRRLRELDLLAPVFEVDARKREDVSMLIQCLLLSIDPTL